VFFLVIWDFFAFSNFKLARRLMQAKPGYKLDHLVKER
jgi:hypothetical protein